eukprot:2874276-Alexandrium_andersonii.AAC.1
MFEEQVVKYLAWEDCAKRESELVGEKKQKEWRADATGALKEVVTKSSDPADVASDLKLRLALQRRSIALDMSYLVSYE